MKYSPLIRKLLTISTDAKYQQVDVAERLMERCTDDADLIRQMLMIAVCDPRFKMHVAGFSSWRSRAEQCLESFAESLMGIPNLTEGEALYRMDEMLERWMRLCVDVVRAIDDERMKYLHGTGADSMTARKIRDALDELLEGKEQDYHPLARQDDDSDVILSWTIAKPEKGEKKAAEKDGEEETEAQMKSEGTKPEIFEEASSKDKQADKGNPDFGIGKSPGRQKFLEDRFLTNVPPSLIRLAKLIGRSGDGIMSTSGSFTSASKSDIGGITVGNDLSSLLPTELALLSEPATQSVFYKNYATRRLQVFASTSHDTKGKKHGDGPIVICMDTSGSMDGEPVLVAKALTMAICIIAQRAHRPVMVVRYSDDHELFRLHNISEQKKAILEFLSVTEMGGNDEDELFRWLFTDIMPNEEEYDSADVLCISDFGWTDVGEKSLELIEREKSKGTIFYGLNIRNEVSRTGFGLSSRFSNNPTGSPAAICDSLWEYRNGEVVRSN